MYGRIDIHLSHGTKVNEECIKNFIEYWKDHPDDTVFNDIEFTINDGYISSISVYPDVDVELSNDIEYVHGLSECIISGYVDFVFVGENYSVWGYRVEPNKVSNLAFLHIPAELTYKFANL